MLVIPRSRTVPSFLSTAGSHPKPLYNNFFLFRARPGGLGGESVGLCEVEEFRYLPVKTPLVGGVPLSFSWSCCIGPSGSNREISGAKKLAKPESG